MIGLSQLNKHPASQLAMQHLKALGQWPDPTKLHLLQLTLDWLHSPHEKTFPFSAYLPELTQEAASLLTRESQAWVASLFVPNPDEMEEHFQANDHPGTTWPILSENLDELAAELRRSPSPDEAGRRLAENLYQGLRQSLLNFGHPSGSTLDQ